MNNMLAEKQVADCIVLDNYRRSDSNQNELLTRRSHKIKVLVDALRLVSQDKDISKESLIIPDDCEKYGFSEGKHNLGQMLHFLADMLEE